MKYFIDENNEIFAYEEDGSQDHLIGNKRQITLDEVQAIVKAKQEAEMNKPENKIKQAKSYLSATDWVIVKISEAVALGDTEKANELKTKYADILTKRQEARDTINSLELK